MFCLNLHSVSLIACSCASWIWEINGWLLQKTFDWQDKILLLNVQECGIRICIFFLVKKLESGKEKDHITHLSFLSWGYWSGSSRAFILCDVLSMKAKLNLLWPGLPSPALLKWSFLMPGSWLWVWFSGRLFSSYWEWTWIELGGVLCSCCEAGEPPAACVPSGQGCVWHGSSYSLSSCSWMIIYPSS